ncbi:MAG: C25 family cysteine peptidase [Acidobacteriota bacterium]
MLPVWASAQAPLPAFKIFLEEAGAYRLGFDDLAQTGLTEALPSSGLGLTSGGEDVPIWVEDGGDGAWGPGDWLEFVGEHLAGEVSHASEHSRYNVYFLRFDHPQPLRMTAGASMPATAEATASSAIERRQHLEQDLMILRLPPTADGESEELWFWAKLVHNAREPFAHTLSLADLASEGTVDLELHFRGWSRPRAKPDSETADHQVDVLLNGKTLTSAQWNGTQPHLVELPALPVSELIQGDNTLVLQVPRRPDGKGRHLIDVVMLNWIEVSYPRHQEVGQGQAQFTLAAGDSAATAEGKAVTPDTVIPDAVVLTSEPGREIRVYGEHGSRFAWTTPASGEPMALAPAADERTFVVAANDELRTPDAVVLDRQTQLASSNQRADYIMVAHHTLIEAVEPLAELHRSRGLTVEIVDVADVYDEFSHGVSHPQALRDFLEHAYHHWQKPAPRFVLLVGDASWDARNDVTIDSNYADWTYRPGESRHFGKNKSTPYREGAELNHRHLVPTWSHTTGQGHSASDNYFVSIEGDDWLPDMAIGRLPVVTAEEVAGIVDKTMRYITEPEVGPWRRNALLITNENRGFQRRSDRLADRLASSGFASHKVYPESTEKSNELHTRNLLDTFDQGQLFVHFLGHGGRYIWRTGPPDLEKNHDLLTLDHLDELQANDRLPVVLSMTCYSAPFDHPSADSIGEKLLRIAGRGAVAVLAASWRNSPSPRWGESLLDELMTPSATIGEAVQRAKHTVGNRMFVETYNLLGDPAVPVALPSANIQLATASAVGDQPLSIEGRVEAEDFEGSVIIDLLNAAGEIVRSVPAEATDSVFDVELDLDPAELLIEKSGSAPVVRAYAWNEELGIDAVGGLTLELPEAPESVAASETEARGKAR